MPKMTHPDSENAIEVTEDQQHEFETQGWVSTDDRPAGNASLESWQEYAAQHNVAVEGLNRDEIRAKFK